MKLTLRVIKSKHLILALCAFIFLSFQNLKAETSCEAYLNSESLIYSDHYGIRSYQPYTLGKDSDPIEVQKANFIRLALKESFPKLDFFVDPKTLPKRLDTMSLLNFFFRNIKAINYVFHGYNEGQVIITDSTSVSNYSVENRHVLQLRFQVANIYGSALLYPLAKIRPLDEPYLIEQWSMFFSLITGKSAQVIK